MRKVTVTSDMSNRNSLTILQQDDGDISISVNAREEDNSDVEICTDGSNLKNSTEIIKHFSAIIDLLFDERDEIVRKIER